MSIFLRTGHCRQERRFSVSSAFYNLSNLRHFSGLQHTPDSRTTCSWTPSRTTASDREGRPFLCCRYRALPYPQYIFVYIFVALEIGSRRLVHFNVPPNVRGLTGHFSNSVKRFARGTSKLHV